MHVINLVALLAAVMCVRRGQAGVSSTQSLPNFNTVTVAVPLNVRITPSSGYSLDVDAEQQVKNALKASVSNNVLNLESHGDFQSHQPIKITVHLPKDQLSQVDNLASSNLVVVDTGFAVGKLAANLAGTGTVYFAGIDASSATIDSSGTTSVFLNGSFQNVNVEGSGVTSTYLSGPVSSLDLQLSGVSKALIDSSSDNLQITGDVNFPSQVKYTKGDCSIGQDGVIAGLSQYTGGVFSNTCQQVSSVNIPTIPLNFTCGVIVMGDFTVSGNNGSSNNCSNGQGNGYGNNGVGNGMGNGNGNGNSCQNGSSVQSTSCAVGTSSISMQ